MTSRIQFFTHILFAIFMFCIAVSGSAVAGSISADDVLRTWNKLALELVRHTPTYSPPIASRSFAYMGVTAYESVASGSDRLQTLAGQLNGLAALPKRDSDATYDEAVILHAALSDGTRNFFGNTGPTGQRAITALDKKFDLQIAETVSPNVALRSAAYGKAIAHHILLWSQSDGGSVIENMGFPGRYDAKPGPSVWVPTSLIQLQQTPLLPKWGQIRTFAMPDGAACPLPAPPPYSEDASSPFYAEANEVYQVRKTLTPEQQQISRFWSDDPMLSPTPPGHWISIAWQIFERDKVPLEKKVNVLARLGIAEADAFIGCWRVKYEFNLLRPVTYIKRVIDKSFEPLLITPPFPEYPSGHSTQSAAAATVLTQAFGENFAFEDATHAKDGIPPRAFASFWSAAEEAAISRLYGGIHFRSAVEQGLQQGRCIGAFVNALKTRK